MFWGAARVDLTRTPAQRFRHRLLERFAALLPTGARVVDIGSGDGATLEHLAACRDDLRLFGVEQSRAGVEATRALVPSATVVAADLVEDELPPEFGGFDAGVCIEVLEHVADPVAFLRSARRLLRPGSRIFVTVPGGPRSAFDHHIGHLRHFDADSLATVLTEAGFHRFRIGRRGFPVFNLYKLVVILRGEALIGDVAGASPSSGDRLARLVMRVFDRLFSFVLADSRFGWQLTAEVLVD